MRHFRLSRGHLILRPRCAYGSSYSLGLRFSVLLGLISSTSLFGNRSCVALPPESIQSFASCDRDVPTSCRQNKGATGVLAAPKPPRRRRRFCANRIIIFDDSVLQTCQLVQQLHTRFGLNLVRFNYLNSPKFSQK